MIRNEKESKGRGVIAGEARIGGSRGERIWDGVSKD